MMKYFTDGHDECEHLKPMPVKRKRGSDKFSLPYGVSTLWNALTNESRMLSDSIGQPTAEKSGVRRDPQCGKIFTKHNFTFGFFTFLLIKF